MGPDAHYDRVVALQVSIVWQAQLSCKEREAMFLLHRRYFERVQRERFDSDLAEKDWVIRLHDGERIVGFSTQRLLTLEWADRPRHFLFSGDTIVDRAHWHEQGLAGAFGHVMLRLMRERGETDLYWFLITKGYRTYRFLPTFFHEFVPGPAAPSNGHDVGDSELSALLHAVASARYGTAFDAERGIIVAGPESDCLRPELRAIPEAKRRDPHVAFFLDRNPGFIRGDELVCLARIQRSNLNRCAWRVIGRTTPAWIEPI